LVNFSFNQWSDIGTGWAPLPHLFVVLSPSIEYHALMINNSIFERNVAQGVLQMIVQLTKSYGDCQNKLQGAINIMAEKGLTLEKLKDFRATEVESPYTDWDYVQTLDDAINLVDNR